jgi:hypothetical protein
VGWGLDVWLCEAFQLYIEEKMGVYYSRESLSA